MAGHKCSHRHSKREGIRVSEICVSQKSRYYDGTMMPPLSLCVHIQLFIKTELKFCVAKTTTSTGTGTDL